METIRIASFNVENFFSRAQVLSEADAARGGDMLRAVAHLQDLLEEEVYDKVAILAVFNDNQLQRYINVRCDRVRKEGAPPRFFFTDASGRAESVNNAIGGAGDWSGAIEFLRERLSGRSREAVTRVLRQDLRADILCLCEMEDRRSLRMLNEQWLDGDYAYEFLLEGNDERGIDVALLSKYPIGGVWSATALRDPGEVVNGRPAPLFNRDCLELEVLTPAGQLYVLCNHFKSKGGSVQAEQTTDRKRLAQSQAVATLLDQRHRRDGEWNDRVVVAGDLNEAADRGGRNGAALGGRATSIDPLLTTPGLHNVLKDRLPLDQRWTYEFAGRREQIDYLLLSEPINQAVVGCGVVYSGRPGAPGVPGPREAASDHAAVWVDIEI